MENSNTCPHCGRPLPEPSEQRTITIRLRVTPAERDQIDAAAKESGLTLSQYIRNSLFQEDTMNNNRIFHLTDDLCNELAARDTNPKYALRRMLEKYLNIIHRGYTTIREKLNIDDLHVICDLADSFNSGSGGAITSVPMINSVSNCLPEYLEKWNVDRNELIHKLESLSAFEQIALNDATAQYLASNKQIDISCLFEEEGSSRGIAL